MKTLRIGILTAMIICVVSPVRGQLPDGHQPPPISDWCTSQEVEDFDTRGGSTLIAEIHEVTVAFQAGHTLMYADFLQFRDRVERTATVCWPLFDLSIYSIQLYADMILLQFHTSHDIHVPDTLQEAHEQTSSDLQLASVASLSYFEATNRDGPKRVDRLILLSRESDRSDRLGHGICGIDEAYYYMLADLEGPGLSLNSRQLISDYVDGRTPDYGRYLQFRAQLWSSIPRCQPLARLAYNSAAFYTDIIILYAYGDIGLPVPDAILTDIIHLKNDLDLLDAVINLYRDTYTSGDLQGFYSALGKLQDASPLADTISEILNQ